MRVAVIQLNSGSDLAQNLNRVEHFLQEAVEQGAALAVLPENFAFMGGHDEEKRRLAESESESALLAFLASQAANKQIAIIGGSLLLKGSKGGVRNCSPVYSASGEQLALYDKIHLFDMDYQGEKYSESALVEAGSCPELVELNGWRIGLSICYDLRFPELYRQHVDRGCRLLCNVAAFTATTGAAHWSVLLRARAIENQCYMIASAQWGNHAGGRKTWGHSMMINPWGEVIAELAEGEGVIVADVSQHEVDKVRNSMPVLQHRRL